MVITLRDLKKIAQVLLNTFEQRGLDEIAFKGDFFWEIEIGSIHDFSTDRPSIYVGSLVDDWGFMKPHYDSRDNAGWIEVHLWKIANFFIEIYRVLAGYEDESLKDDDPRLIISLADLWGLLRAVIDQIEWMWFTEVDCSAIDKYWKVVCEDRQDFSNINPRVIIGSLEQDWEKLSSLLDRSRGPEVADFEKFGYVLLAFVHEEIHLRKTREESLMYMA